MPTFKAKYTATERKAFGALLRQLMVEKGINGAELARQANRRISSGPGMDRSSISQYINARSMPGPVHLNAIAAVLGVSPQMLLPRDHAQRPNEIGFATQKAKGVDMRMALMPGGKMHLIVNGELPLDVGYAIMELVRTVEGKEA